MAVKSLSNGVTGAYRLLSNCRANSAPNNNDNFGTFRMTDPTLHCPYRGWRYSARDVQ